MTNSQAPQPGHEQLRTLRLTVDIFAGTDINDAARELCQLAGQVGVLIEADFNGVKLWARPGDDATMLADSYHVELRRPGNVYRIAQAR